MTTAIQNVDDTTYTQLAVADALVQNTSAYPIRVIFNGSLPAVDAVAFHTLVSGDAILKSSGLPSGNIYARCDRVGKTSSVVVSD